jgi:FkbM family methyltransferase
VRFAPPQLIHWGKSLVDPNYRHLKRLESIPRFQPTITNIFGKPFEMGDAATFVSNYRPIFDDQIYRFKADKERPFILDCGANIGLSVIYFKRLYPGSVITAFEADKEIFKVLKKNIQSFGYNDVELVNRAVWNSETELNFTSDGGDAGRLSMPNDTPDHLVKTVRLRNYLDHRIDFLKLDIEGAETMVLEDCADSLQNVETLFVEYHSFDGESQSLHILVDVLAQAGFRLHIQAPMPAPQPFIKRHPIAGMDMQLNVFAFRPDFGYR